LTQSTGEIDEDRQTETGPQSDAASDLTITVAVGPTATVIVRSDAASA